MNFNRALKYYFSHLVKDYVTFIQFLLSLDPRSHSFEASPLDASAFSFSSFSFFFFFISFRILFFSFLRFFSFFSPLQFFLHFSFVLSSRFFILVSSSSESEEEEEENNSECDRRKNLPHTSFSYHNIVTDLLDRGCIKVIIARGHRKGSLEVFYSLPYPHCGMRLSLRPQL